jgi:cell division protein FtsN
MLLVRLTCANAPPQPGGDFMAPRTLRPKSRIFVDRKPAWSRLLGATLLLVALAVTVSGIGTAVFLNRASAPALSSAVAQAIAPLPAPAPPPAESAAAVPPIPQPPEPPAEATTLAAVEPQAGGTVPPLPAAAPTPAQAAPGPVEVAQPPAQTAALPSQSAPASPPAPALDTPPPSVTPADEHWVEYGVFVLGSGYAERLKQRLAEKGLGSVIVRTHDRLGHPLLRVRSAPLADLAAAEAAAHRAEGVLRITPLVHSGAPAIGPVEKRFWVQFGAFHEHAGAARVQRRLARIGVQASVSTVRGESGKPLYLVRSEPLSTHDAAVALAGWAQPAAGTAGLVGETPVGEAEHPAPGAKPLRPVADSR